MVNIIQKLMQSPGGKKAAAALWRMLQRSKKNWSKKGPAKFPEGEYVPDRAVRATPKGFHPAPKGWKGVPPQPILRNVGEKGGLHMPIHPGTPKGFKGKGPDAMPGWKHGSSEDILNRMKAMRNVNFKGNPARGPYGFRKTIPGAKELMHPKRTRTHPLSHRTQPRRSDRDWLQNVEGRNLREIGMERRRIRPITRDEIDTAIKKRIIGATRNVREGTFKRYWEEINKMMGPY